MILRWLHKSWKYLWGIILAVLLLILLVVGSVIGLLQLDITHNYLLDRIENRVEQEYKAQLSVGDLDGFLPFNVQLQDVALVSRDSIQADTLAKIGSIENRIDIWELLQNKVSITGFIVNDPEVWLRKGSDGKIAFLERVQPRADTTQTREEPWLSNIEVLAPNMEITGGTLHLQSMTDGTQALSLPPSVTISGLNANLFLEWTEQQRYLDIESISAETDLPDLRQFSMRGQIYSDQRFLEFNSFYFHVGNSELTLNGEIDGVDLGQFNIADQFLSAHYDLDVVSTALYPREFRQVIPSAPNVEGPFTFRLYTEGSTESLQVDEVSLSKGESLFQVNGIFRNLRQPDTFSYEVSIDSVNLRRQDIRSMVDTLQASRYEPLEDLTMRGTANGSLDSIDVDLAVRSPRGLVNIQGGSQLQDPYQYDGTMDGRNVDISWLAPSVFDTTALNFEGQLAGYGFDLKQSMSDFDLTFIDSRVDQRTFDRLQLTSSLRNGYWYHRYNYQNGEQRITGSGTVDFSRERPPIAMEGNARNINLAELVPDTSVASTKLNFDYNVDITGTDPNSIEGRASFDVAPSVINDDSVQAHQFYADINTLDNQRRFRLTSSLFDMHVEGDLYPDEMIRQGRFWSAYLQDRYQSEIKIDSTASGYNPMPPPTRNIVLDGSIRAKNLSFIKRYLPQFPSVFTDSRINFNVNSDQNRLLLSTEVQADTLRFNQWGAKGAQTQLTASFRSDQPLREAASVDFKADIGTLHTTRLDMDSVGIAFAFKQDSLYYRQQVNNIGENARFDMELNGGISDSSIVASVEDFYLGNDSYAWTKQGTPVLNFMEQDRVVFSDFRFENQDEYFQLQGALSSSEEDSLSYTLRDINLTRISDLVRGNINFGGILNGRLITRSLVDQPTIQGELGINRLTLNDRIVGDVSFNSGYNRSEDRFDTRIEVLTDPQKYEDYLEANDGVRQHFVLDGYFSTSESAPQDSLFYFDADFKQVDMWLIPLLVDNIFQEMEGEAVGEGYVSGNFDDFDFHADFETQGVFAKPRFINTNYFINGPVTLDRQDGVVLDSLSVMDTKGGTGTLWGTIDLNDFKPLTYLDLSLAMNRLQILNSNMDPDVPFFGNISGTGTIRLSGSNTDMYMRTENPVQLANSSRLSIPLLEETELNETGQFIRFVDSFEDRGRTPGGTPTGNGDEEAPEEAFREAIQDLTFSERFDLDLRFNTDNDIAVNLIFDPVTGEKLNARGAGQMRISMQDQEVQMFGQYKINSGTYQFVTGEIISRQLDLQPGGTIAWEGPPDNARLDISAVYHARPNISTLTAEGPIESQGQNNSQQIPIDLIVDITGTLNSVENSYYFQLPSSLDLSSAPTLSYTINQINRDEQQKLLQATSILFTGQFIPTQGAGSATASLSQSLTRGSTVLNPLLSNQVISPLLSNQINALLNSDVSRMDIDFNLNAYNEVDLGIALRLYNDRLILRREGQITGGGPQTTLGDRIGDLNATYRINRRLSLTAFHRRNQILSNYGTQSQTGDVTPSVDGIGLETQFQFNTWQELWNKVWGISPATEAREEEIAPDTSATKKDEAEEK